MSRLAFAAVVVVCAWLLAFGQRPGLLAPALAASVPTPTPYPKATPAAPPGEAGQMLQLGMGPFQVPPAPTAVTRFYDAGQRQQGGQVYEQRCSTCHGDAGQGLTAEWRATWPPEKQNCWQSKCHSSNHPPDGFVLPRYVPPVIGGNSLARFASAQELFEYIRTQMPYHAPDSLSAPDYWALTAFLLDAHQVTAPGQVLDAATASGVRLASGAASTSGAVDWRLAGVAVVVLLAVAGTGVWRRVLGQLKNN